MLKRIIAGILTAAVIPLCYLLFVSSGNNFKSSESITDEQGYRYTLLYNFDNIMFIKSDNNGKILGKWQSYRSNEYYHTFSAAMRAFNGEFYCVLDEKSSKDFKIRGRKWLKIDFDSGSAEVIYEKKEYPDDYIAYDTELTVADNIMMTASAVIGGILVTDAYAKEDYFIKPQMDAAVNYASVLPDKRIIYSDVLNRIYISDIYGNSRLIYKADKVGSFYNFYVDADGYCRISDAQTDMCLITADNTYKGDCAFVELYGTEYFPHIPRHDEPFNKGFLISCAAGIAAGIIVVVLMSVKSFPFLCKIAVIIVLCLGIGGGLLYTQINRKIKESIFESSVEKAFVSAKSMSEKIDVERFMKIDWGSVEADDYFPELVKIMALNTESERKLKADGHSYTILDDKSHCWIYPVISGEIRSGICSQYPVNIPLEKVVPEDVADEYKKVAAGKINAAVCGVSDYSSDWVTIAAPLKNSDSEIAALIEMRIPKLYYTTASKQDSTGILLIVAVFEIITGALILTAAGIALLPLKKLHSAVMAAGKGEYGVSVRVGGRDEIARIAKEFNIMSGKIYDHTKSLSELNEAYLRFLPSEIITKIGKESVLSVSRGDYSSISDYILHIRLINFSEQTEGMPDDDVFELINDISREIVDNILNNSGVIESYNQEEYICIFGEADQAYKAAVGLVKRLRGLYPSLKTAFVIVRDSMLLGIVGHEERLGTIMLSRGIRLSKKLAETASVCAANLIVTSDVTFSEPCPQRLLGKINFDGREYTFFDCFEGDEISRYINKRESCGQFEEMVNLFYENKFSECRRCALRYLEKYRNDSAAIRYLFLCENNIKNSDTEGGCP